MHYFLLKRPVLFKSVYLGQSRVIHQIFFFFNPETPLLALMTCQICEIRDRKVAVFLDWSVNRWMMKLFLFNLVFDLLSVRESPEMVKVFFSKIFSFIRSSRAHMVFKIIQSDGTFWLYRHFMNFFSHAYQLRAAMASNQGKNNAVGRCRRRPTKKLNRLDDSSSDNYVLTFEVYLKPVDKEDEVFSHADNELFTKIRLKAKLFLQFSFDVRCFLPKLLFRSWKPLRGQKSPTPKFQEFNRPRCCAKTLTKSFSLHCICDI